MISKNVISEIDVVATRHCWLGRSTIEFMSTVLSYSLSGLSMLINLTEDTFVKDSFNPLCAPLDLTDILNSYPNLTRGIWVQE